jgi:hypothetical protein
VGSRSSEFKIVLPFFFGHVGSENGFTDVVLSNYGFRHGVNYVVYGHNDTKTVDVALFTLKVSQGLTLSPAVSYDFSGRSVSNAGDVNGDGNDDLIIGVPGASLCYVLMGTARGWVNMTQGFTVFGGDGDNTGWSVSGAGYFNIHIRIHWHNISITGDVNGDQFADIIIGAPGVNYGTGATYVLFGKQEGFRNIILSELEVDDGFMVQGVSLSDYSGMSVSGAGTWI